MLLLTGDAFVEDSQHIFQWYGACDVRQWCEPEYVCGFTHALGGVCTSVMVCDAALHRTKTGHLRRGVGHCSSSSLAAVGGDVV